MATVQRVKRFAFSVRAKQAKRVVRRYPDLACLTHRRQSDDAGFSLVELTVVIVIMPLIVGAITFALLGVFNLQTGVTNRITDSAAAQVVAANFVKDVQSANVITTQSLPQCGTGTQLLGLKWAKGQDSISYSVVPVGSGATTTYSLVRSQCVLANTATPTSVSTITGDILANQAPPAVVCNTNVASCLSPLNAGNVSTVAFNIYEPASKYGFTLTAAPRDWIAASGVSSGGSPYAAVTLLNTSGTCPSTVLSVANNATLAINVGSGTNDGVLAISSSCPNSVTVGNGGSLRASSIVTSDPSLNSVSTNAQASYPTSEVYATLSDPFVSLVGPTAPTSPGSCTNHSGSNWVCTPGLYASYQSFPNNADITFAPGNYDFAAGLNIPNKATATFGTGQYTFAGSSASGGVALATYNAKGTTVTGNSVLFYVSSGDVDFGNNGAISLTGQSAYNGVVVWNAGTGAVNLANNSSTVNSYGGVYAPQGSVNVSNNGAFATSFIVAGSASLSSNATILVTSP
jgi:prepilin-type N-terminal cleavage/methylation domain-containing protein